MTDERWEKKKVDRWALFVDRTNGEMIDEGWEMGEKKV